MKIWFFSIVDFAIFAVTFSSYMIMHEKWDDCVYQFNEWAISIIACSFSSFILNFLQVYNLRMEYNYLKKNPNSMETLQDSTNLFV